MRILCGSIGHRSQVSRARPGEPTFAIRATHRTRMFGGEGGEERKLPPIPIVVHLKPAVSASNELRPLLFDRCSDVRNKGVAVRTAPASYIIPTWCDSE